MRVVFVYAALISALIWLAVADSGDDNDDDDADDFVDDEGNFDLSKWQQHMQPCDNLDDDDAWVKCMNERQPFMKVRYPPSTSRNSSSSGVASIDLKGREQQAHGGLGWGILREK